MNESRRIDDNPAPSVAQFDIFFNSAFFVGSALSGDRLLAYGFEAAQRKVHALLEDADRGAWTVPRTEDRKGRWFDNAEAFTTLVPLSFMRYEGATARSLIEREIEALRSQPLVAAASPELLSVWADFQDSGVGTFCMRMRFSPSTPLPLVDVRELREILVEGLTDCCNNLIASLAKSYVDACREGLPRHFVVTPWYQDVGPHHGVKRRAMPNASVPGGLNRMLWVHSTYIVNGEGQPPDFEQSCLLLLPSVVHGEIETGPDLFIPGLGASVLIRNRVTGPARGPVTERLILDLMNLQWGVYAVAMEADRTLLVRAGAFSSSGASAPATVLEREAQAVLALNDRTRAFQNSIKTILMDLGGEATRVWNEIARVQDLSWVLECVDQKLDALQRACQNQITFASAKRQRRLGIAVDLFTTFSVLASVAGIASFVFATDIRAEPVTRALVVIGALVGVLLVGVLARIGGRRAGRR